MTNRETGRLLNLFEVGEATGRDLILSKKSPVVYKVSEENTQELFEKCVISKIGGGQAGEDQYMITGLELRVRNGQIEV